MWFIFFFGTAIPAGLLMSLVGLLLYYAIDKYNSLRRRTVKESIGPKLSLGC
jgi:amino acid permease